MDEENEASKKIARSLLGGEEIIFNKKTQSNTYNFLKKFPTEYGQKHMNMSRETAVPIVEEIDQVNFETFYATARDSSEKKRLESLANSLEADYGPFPHERYRLINWLREYGERLMLPGSPKGSAAGELMDKDYQAWIKTINITNKS